MPKIHDRCPTEIESRRLKRCLPTSKHHVMEASQKPSRQFGLQASSDGRDIGYTRSGADELSLL
jgi:hypothetical protein